MSRIAQASYLALLLVVALLSGGGFYFASWAVKVRECRTTQHPGSYLAYCSHPLFGSYEHEAYGFGLQPGAIKALQRAQVLFLGNSRVEYAFSTPQVDKFFQDRGKPYHILAFGYAESSGFSRLLLDRYHPTPKVLVINTDPFFNDNLSPPAQEVADGHLATYFDALMKKAYGALVPYLCRIPNYCTEKYGATYRDTRSGQWVWHEVLFPASAVGVEITDKKIESWSETDLPVWQRNAESFLANAGVPRTCVILTATPNPRVYGEGIAMALGRRLSLPVVLPQVAGLTSADTSHFSAGSAERWSAAFLGAAAPIIDRCLGL